jgi:hypothetical protein
MCLRDNVVISFPPIKTFALRSSIADAGRARRYFNEL